MTDILLPRVFIIEQPKQSKRGRPLNLSPLYEHGNPQIVIPKGFTPAYTPRAVSELVESALFPEQGRQYDPEVDYFVWAGGDALTALLVGMMLAEREIWCFRWLRYERPMVNGERVDEGAVYVPCVIDLSDSLEDQLDLEMTNAGD